MFIETEQLHEQLYAHMRQYIKDCAKTLNDRVPVDDRPDGPIPMQEVWERMLLGMVTAAATRTVQEYVEKRLRSADSENLMVCVASALTRKDVSEVRQWFEDSKYDKMEAEELGREWPLSFKNVQELTEFCNDVADTAGFQDTGDGGILAEYVEQVLVGSEQDEAQAK